MKTLLLFKNSKAETLAEVLIAVMVLSVGATGILTLLNTSVRATDFGKERLEAYNLAREGMEAVLIFRDTAWLRFPANHADCWDTWDVTEVTQCTNPMTKFSDGHYYKISKNLDNFTWEIVDLGTSEPPIPNTTPANDTTLYLNSTPLWETPAVTGSILTHDVSPSPTPYHRWIFVEKSDTFSGDGILDTMTVTATVRWESRGTGKEVIQTKKIYNE